MSKAVDRLAKALAKELQREEENRVGDNMLRDLYKRSKDKERFSLDQSGIPRDEGDNDHAP